MSVNADSINLNKINQLIKMTSTQLRVKFASFVFILFLMGATQLRAENKVEVADTTKPKSNVFELNMDDKYIIIDGKELDLSKLAEKMESLTKDFEKSFGEKGERIEIFGDSMVGDWKRIFERMQENGGGLFSDSSRIKNFFFNDKDFGGLIDSNLFNKLNSFDLGNLPMIMEGFGNDFSNELNPERPVKRSNKIGIQEALTQQLSADGFNVKSKEVKIEITDKTLKINGDKQPANLHSKYKRLIEIETGLEIEEGAKLEYKVSDKKVRTKLRG
jgi:HSP20 family molecular chaperone IbpA